MPAASLLCICQHMQLPTEQEAVIPAAYLIRGVAQQIECEALLAAPVGLALGLVSADAIDLVAGSSQLLSLLTQADSLAGAALCVGLGVCKQHDAAVPDLPSSRNSSAQQQQIVFGQQKHRGRTAARKCSCWVMRNAFVSVPCGASLATSRWARVVGCCC